MKNTIPLEIWPLIDATLEQVHLDVRNNHAQPGHEARQVGYEKLKDLALSIKNSGPQTQRILLLDMQSEVEALGPVLAKWRLIALAKGLFELNEWSRTGRIGVDRRASYAKAKQLINLAAAQSLTLDIPLHGEPGYINATVDALKEELKSKNIFGLWGAELRYENVAACDHVTATLTNNELELSFGVVLSDKYLLMSLPEAPGVTPCWVTRDTAAQWCEHERDRYRTLAEGCVEEANRFLANAKALKKLAEHFSAKLE